MGSINKFRTKLYLIEKDTVCRNTIWLLRKTKHRLTVIVQKKREKRNSDTLGCGCAGNEFCDDDSEILNS